MARCILLLFILFLGANISFGQNSILSGKIVDEKNAPIKDALIKICKEGLVMEAHSDEDGLFYSQLLWAGSYHVDVYIGNKRFKARKVYLTDATRKKSYYYLQVIDNKVIVTVDGQDPFLKSKLGKLDNVDYRSEIFFEGSLGSFRVKVDSAGNIMSQSRPLIVPMRVSAAK